MLESLFEIEEEERLAQQGNLAEMGSLFGFRAKRRAVRLSNYLLNEEGKLQHLQEIITALEKEGEIFSPEGYNDSDITAHFLKVLYFLKKRPDVIIRLQSLGLPLANSDLEGMIAATLEIELPLSDRDLIWALLSLLLCPLRQSVGSCFATAPAIIVHEEQFEFVLEDLQSLLMKGELKRIFGGVEFSVPISPSPGLGNLPKLLNENSPQLAHALNSIGKRSEIRSLVAPFVGKTYLEFFNSLPYAQEKAKWAFIAFNEHLLLKIWEFTFASFADVKTEFSRWNLYASLGFNPEEKGGIGELIYHHLDRRLIEVNQEVEKLQQEVEIAFDQVRATEYLLRAASSENEIRRLKAEHTSRLYHLNICEEMRDKVHNKAKHIANFFDFLIESYIEEIQRHFQEIYDANMQEIKGDEFDDSPAGFRLVYKHGRSHVGSWTFIYSQNEYIQALKDFFLSVENSMIHKCEWEEGKQEISYLTTQIIHFLPTEEFLKTAFNRLAKARKAPLKPGETPWAYISGGTIPTLLKTYFRREGTLSEESRWIENPQDLLIFLLETLKTLPPRIADAFTQNREKRMLMTSPTHAFSLLPGKELFAKGWHDPGFTYTWVRDEIVIPRQEFYHSIKIEPLEQRLLVEEFAKKLPLLLAHSFNRGVEISYYPLSISSFYENAKENLPDSFISRFESFLFEMLPLVTPEKGKEFLTSMDLEAPKFYQPMGRRPFHDEVAHLIRNKRGVCFSKDIHDEISQKMEKKGLTPPSPLLFADPNWEKFYFSFVVSPVTLELELWRTDKIGLTGMPMKEWEEWLSGISKDAWGIYLYPYQYTL